MVVGGWLGDGLDETNVKSASSKISVLCAPVISILGCDGTSITRSVYLAIRSDLTEIKPVIG